MALKPTIYKAHIELADSDHHRFDTLNLTLARHPSETLERMAVRLLAYCLNAGRGLEFTRGLSTADEPDLWQYSDDLTQREGEGRATDTTVWVQPPGTPSVGMALQAPAVRRSRTPSTAAGRNAQRVSIRKPPCRSA